MDGNSLKLERGTETTAIAVFELHSRVTYPTQLPGGSTLLIRSSPYATDLHENRPTLHSHFQSSHQGLESEPSPPASTYSLFPT
ncbi:hypothetical protein IQ06DRAFT_102858 [Phaeosphaeriaceae sp. SRC1lsM3a]|nr:hypothetical protein IQ06DRAFT_102858 [Stagonospora sp. SRC1lsM3a]